jgi:hypothetical protein
LSIPNMAELLLEQMKLEVGHLQETNLGVIRSGKVIICLGLHKNMVCGS